MTGPKRRASLVVCAVALALCGAAPAASAASAASDTAPVRVELDQSSVHVGIGQGFGFTSAITNDSDQPLTNLVAHLNVASADGSTYVDPEDWSSHRSQYVDTLAAHETRQLSWNVHAVNGGALVVYVAVTTGSGPDFVVTSGPLRATVTSIRRINAAGVLPIAITMPVALMVLLGLALQRRRSLG